jgi:salicylate hydroxylase
LKGDRNGAKVDLHLGVKVVRVDVENAETEMEDGEV